MRVKVGEQWFGPKPGQPVMIVINKGEREQIANMAPEATKYAQFDDADDLTNEQKLEWMCAGEERQERKLLGEKHRCGSPNKPPEGSPVHFGAGEDDWRVEANGDRCCTFCGSLHPEEAIAKLKCVAAGEDGYRFDGTGKGYKIYVSGPNVSNASEGGLKFYSWHATAEQLVEINELIKSINRRAA